MTAGPDHLPESKKDKPRIYFAGGFWRVETVSSTVIDGSAYVFAAKLNDRILCEARSSALAPPRPTRNG